MAAEEPEISLGFVANPENADYLKSNYFPSKVGGKPAWLSPANLPPAKDLTCPLCKKPFVFLLQAYAPLDDSADSFHRTVFVFACRNAPCYDKNDNKPFAVFRSQLPKVNDFYSAQPFTAGSASKGEVTFSELVNPDSPLRTPLCCVCGCSGSVWCSRCRGPRYCGKEHQTLHWKRGHKSECRPVAAEGGDKQKAPIADSKWSRVIAMDASLSVWLPEMELAIETESELERVDDDSGNESETDEEEGEDQRLKDFDAFVRSHGNAGALDGEVSNAELAEAAAEGVGITDTFFKAFKKRMALAPEQVLRHNRDGSPLWLTTDHQAGSEDVPDCSCGAKRTFEFQILPQLLAHLHLDTLEAQSVDWATLAVYTCSKSCDALNGYKREFLWKQDF